MIRRKKEKQIHVLEKDGVNFGTVTVVSNLKGMRRHSTFGHVTTSSLPILETFSFVSNEVRIVEVFCSSYDVVLSVPVDASSEAFVVETPTDVDSELEEVVNSIG